MALSCRTSLGPVKSWCFILTTGEIPSAAAVGNQPCWFMLKPSHHCLKFEHIWANLDEPCHERQLRHSQLAKRVSPWNPVPGHCQEAKSSSEPSKRFVREVQLAVCLGFEPRSFRVQGKYIHDTTVGQNRVLLVNIPKNKHFFSGWRLTPELLSNEEDGFVGIPARCIAQSSSWFQTAPG